MYGFYFRGDFMEKKYNRAVLFFLISAVGMLIIEQYNSVLYHFLIEIATVFIGLLIFIIAINSRVYSERSILLSVGVAYIYVCIFDFLHMLSYNSFSTFEFDMNITTQLWLTARIIEAMSLVVIFSKAIFKSKINYSMTHVFLIGYTITYIVLIFTDVLPPVIQDGKPLLFRNFVEGFIIVTFIVSLVLARKVEMRKDVKLVFTIVIVLKILTEISFVSIVYMDEYMSTIAHVFKYLSFGGLYTIFVYETIHDPYANVYRMFAKREKELTFKAERDSLTGIYDHSTTFSKVDDRINNIKEYDSLAVVLIDIDDFKDVNDKYGHQKGDEVLREFAQMLLTCDIENKVIGRYGGDEFVVCGTNFKKETALENFAYIQERMKKLVEKTKVNFTFSAGVAFYEKGDTTKDLIYKADIKMYEAKRLGKNQFVIW